MARGTTGSDWLIRTGRDSDAKGIIALIRTCWSAYPGIRMDVDAEMPELRALASYYGSQNGALWVAAANSQMVGMIAVRPIPERPIGERSWEVCRVYVDPTLHGSGLADALMDVAEAHAIAANAARLALWSDTRFERAHHFYEKRSYVRSGPVRVLHDISDSLEFGYTKPVSGVEVLDIAAATSAEVGLAAILQESVAAGAMLGFVSPLTRGEATAFWHNVAGGVGRGQRLLAAGWAGGVLVGAGIVDLATPPNQRHRAAIEMLLVHPKVRRQGLGRHIMVALERSALAAGRRLLTVEGAAAGEAFWQALGWQEVGRVPDYALDAAGNHRSGVFWWKRPTM